MNLHVQRIIRHGVTMLAALLGNKGFLDATLTDQWTNGLTEFATATVLALAAYGWSAFNAYVLKKKPD